LCHWIFSLM